MAAAEGDDRSLEFPAHLEQVSALVGQETPESFNAAGRAERGRCVCKRASSLTRGVQVLC